MRSKGQILTAATACLLAVGGLGAEPAKAKQAGLYLEQASKDGADELVRLHGTMAQMRQKGIVKTMLLMGHAKPSLVAELSGTKAEVRAAGRSPVFTFYLPPAGGDRMSAAMEDAMRMMTGDAPPSQAKSGVEFVLVRFTAKDGNREAEVGQEKGSRTRDTLPCSSERVGDSLFRVSATGPLPPGEYGFYWGEHGFGGVLWDFGVDEP